ncbi:YlbF family regulator [Pisciglobus halotolerans]|uniref:UPF0342 protein SAMN04489868_1225 n=1 Tax=Pisciglobus halotolerans TaxID=745365 RepID=A0A1I3CRW4_9LACT|nr:YlbF family regulator [Pisciglobus halotolerans]SFH77197.1 Cell fate regulator YlbF, YheA/YmcA/DUF963 family (controls sporulation, competence, biofilm development) [Pisciglobus halotolerans]
MSNNIYDTANQLEKDLRESEAYVALENAFTALKEDTEASSLFQSVQEVQMKLQQKQQAGEEITEEDIQDAQATSVKASENEKVLNLMNAEQQISTMINDLNRIIMKPVQDLYQN